jgi:hypothetical protein
MAALSLDFFLGTLLVVRNVLGVSTEKDADLATQPDTIFMNQLGSLQQYCLGGDCHGESDLGLARLPWPNRRAQA